MTSEPGNLQLKGFKLDGEAVQIQNFIIEAFEKHQVIELLAMPSQIESKLTKKQYRYVNSTSSDIFRLIEYPGCNNKVSLIENDADNIIFYG